MDWKEFSNYLKETKDVSTFFDYDRFSTMKSRDEFEGEIAEVVDKLAAILGLNKKIISRRLELYWPNHQWCMPGSMVDKLAANVECEELAEKILADLESLNPIFADQMMETQYE